jgi:peptidoglycan hydrolase CwlO-like protein
MASYKRLYEEDDVKKHKEMTKIIKAEAKMRERMDKAELKRAEREEKKRHEQFKKELKENEKMMKELQKVVDKRGIKTFNFRRFQNDV